MHAMQQVMTDAMDEFGGRELPSGSGIVPSMHGILSGISSTSTAPRDVPRSSHSAGNLAFERSSSRGGMGTLHSTLSSQDADPSGPSQTWLFNSIAGARPVANFLVCP
jgi:hypothetical protein